MAAMQGFPVHPHAAAFCRVAGIKLPQAQDLLSEVAMELPEFQIGGYFIDAAILTLWWALSSDAEENGWTHTDLMERIVEAMRSAYEWMVR